MGLKPNFNTFGGLFMTPDTKSLGKKFLDELEKLTDLVNKLVSQIMQLEAAAPVSSGVVSVETPVKITNTIGATQGSLVVYRGSTLALATNTNLDYEAIYAVGYTDDLYMYLYQNWSSGLLRIDSGRGTNAEGRLYLSQSGRCTDQMTDVIDSNGDWQNGAVLLQFVGTSQLLGPSGPAGFVRCALGLRLSGG